LASYKKPAIVEFIDALPKMSSEGKRLNQEMAKAFVEINGEQCNHLIMQNDL
jgi:hypothetical protein